MVLEPAKSVEVAVQGRAMCPPRAATNDWELKPPETQDQPTLCAIRSAPVLTNYNKDEYEV